MTSISVCIPTYENPQGALRAVESTFAQTFNDFECIVTDDSNGNDIADALAPFMNDPRFVYKKNTVPLGPPANWNFAITQATGKYIKMLHHDDWFASPAALSAFFEAAEERPECGFIVSDCYNVSSSMTVTHDIDSKNLQSCRKNPYSLLLGNCIGGPSVTMVARDIQELYDENIRWFVDIEYYKRLLDVTGVVHIRKRLINLTWEDENQVTHACLADPFLQLREQIYILAKHLPLYFFRYSAMKAVYPHVRQQAHPLAALRDAGMSIQAVVIYFFWHIFFAGISFVRKAGNKLLWSHRWK